MTEHERPESIDELLDRAVRAVNRGDRATASTLAERVLAVDHQNAEAEDILVAPDKGGELRRLTLFFCDLVDSTELSTVVEPETYRAIVGTYRDRVQRIVETYDGHIGSTKGDGLLVVFGFPHAHENDVHRAVRAGLEITREVTRLSEAAQRRFGVGVSVRVGVHRGLVYLDTAQDDVYGLAANLTARISGLAPPGTVVVSDSVEPLIRDTFDLAALPAREVKGIQGLIPHYQVLGELLSRTRNPLAPLVGRHNELNYLQWSWEQARAGTLTKPAVAFLGEPGIGKSRLATAATEMARQSGAVVLTLLGSPFHTAAGLHPVRTLIERRCAITSDSSRAERLQRLQDEICSCGMDTDPTMPLLAPVLGIAAKQDYRPIQAEGARLYDEIARGIQDYLFACLGDGPGLMLVEDLHWFDPATLEVVDSLVNAASSRLLIVITGREGAKLPDAAKVESFELKPLTDTETDQLITALAPGISDSDRANTARRCDGVPLYIEELLADPTHQPPPGTGQVPDALYESLVSRLRASPQSGPVIEAAATIGREVNRELLLAVLGMPEDDLDATIGDLTDKLILEPAGANAFRFRHELQREVAYELAPPSVRQSLHGRVADALVAGSGDNAPDWQLIAAHYDEAERFSESTQAYQKAAADARLRGALGEARVLLTAAITQVRRAPPGSARVAQETDLLLRRGFLASAMEGTASAQAAADFQRCLEIATAQPSERLFVTLTPLYGYYATRGDIGRAEQVLKAIDAGFASGPDGFRSNTAGLAMIAWYRGEFDKALAGLTSAADHADIDAREQETRWFMPNEPVASVYTHLAAARFVIGDHTGAQRAMAQAQKRVERLDFPQGPYSHAYARSYETWMNIEAGRLDHAADIVAAMTEQARRYHFAGWMLIAETQRASVDALSLLATGSPDAQVLQPHIAAMTMFIESWRTVEMKMFLTFYDSVLARLLAAAGRPDAARDRLDTALGLAADTDVHFYDAELLRLRAHTEQAGEARRAGLAAARELAIRQGAVIFELRSATDDFTLSGDRNVLTAAVNRFPVDSTWPELTRARALLG